MSKIEDLIKQYCPDGVEWKRLGDVCDITTGKLNANAAVTNGKYLFFTCSSEPSYIDEYAFDTDAILISGNGNVGELHSYCGKFNAYQRTYVLDKFADSVMKMYLYHYMNEYLTPYTIKNCRKGSVPYITLSMLQDFQIPIPHIAVQDEIVRILDKFTELEKELEKELELRRKQYEFYRDKLLTFGDDVEHEKLGEVGCVRMCKRIMKDQTSSTGDVPFYKIGTFGGTANAYITQELFDEYSSRYNYPKKGNVLISAAGTIGRTVVFDGKPSYFQDSNIVWLEHDGTQVTDEYLKYIYSTSPWYVADGGTISRLYNDNILNAVIPVPSLTEQERIVKILDKFDTLTTSLTSGFPAEIKLRKQQYEYYRDYLFGLLKCQFNMVNHHASV